MTSKPTRTRLLLLACGLLWGCEPLDGGFDFPADAGRRDTADGVTNAPLRLIFFDVGTGASTLVWGPSGRTLLVDLGVPQVVEFGHEADAAIRVVEAIESITGRRGVDCFVASHYHSDHVGKFDGSGASIGGIPFAVEALGFEVDLFVDRGRSPAGDSETQEPYLRWVESRGNHRTIADAGPFDAVDLGDGVRIDVVAPPGAGLAGEGACENALSISIRITFGSFDVSLTGDLSGEANQWGLVDVETTVAPAMGAVEICQVNHHGSGSSSNPFWTDTLRPIVSIFPVGRNRYGFPDEEVVGRLDAWGDLFFTGDGDVFVESPDGAAFTVNGAEYASLSDEEEALRSLW